MGNLSVIEAYLDATPRTGARAVPAGPFTLFVGQGPWSYYARPRLGLGEPMTALDVQVLEARCREEHVPLSIEWVQETTPSLAAAARAAGLTVAFRPLMALDLGPEPAAGEGMETASVARILQPGEASAAAARAVADLGFGDPGTAIGPAGAREREILATAMEPGLLLHMHQRAVAGHSVTAAAMDDTGIVAVGVHQPVGETTEIVGVATLPAARRRGLAAAVTRALLGHARATGVRTAILSADSDDVARIYERVGFRRVGTSCEAGPAVAS